MVKLLQSIPPPPFFFLFLLLILLHSYYLDRVVDEIAEGLQEQGQMDTQKLGERFNLVTSFLEKALLRKINSGKLKAYLQNGVSCCFFL